MNLTLCLTHDCAMACSYCYAGEKSKKVMSLKTAEAAIDFALKQDNKPFQLGFFGGEPLQEWNLLQKATQIAKEKITDRKLVFTLTTNGIGLTSQRVETLHQDGFFLGVSIDGNRQMHDACRRLRTGASSFDAVFKGLKNALAYPERVEAIMVIDPDNVSYAADGFAFLANAGVKRISFNPNFYVAWDKDSLAKLEQAYEAAGDHLLRFYREGSPVTLNVLDAKIITRLKDGYSKSDRCGFGCQEIAVAPSGNIYPCERLVGEDEDPEVCIGSIFTGFDMAKRVALLGKRGNQDLECTACSLRSRCMNWCGCINYTTTGAIDSAPGLVCFHEQLSIRVADRIAGQLYEELNTDFISRFYD